MNEIWTNADYAITAQNNFSPIPIAAANAAAKSPASRRSRTCAPARRAFGKKFFATGVNPPAARCSTSSGSRLAGGVLALGADGAFIDKGYAKKHELVIGSPIDMTFADGERKTFHVRGIFDPPTGGSPFGTVTISQTAWDS